VALAIKIYRFLLKIADINLRILQIGLKLIKLKKISNFSAFFNSLKDFLDVYVISILDPSPMKYRLDKMNHYFDKALTERNKLLYLSYEAYQQGKFDDYKKYTLESNFIEDETARSRGFNPMSFRFIGSNILDSIGHTFAALSMRTLMKKFGDAPVREYLIIDSNNTKNDYSSHWSEYFPVTKVPRMHQKVIENGFWPIYESVSTVRTNRGILEHRELHNYYAKQGQKNHSRPPLKLQQEKLQEGYRILNSIGIKQSDWFVTLHVRDSGDISYGRNANINSYLEAINFIISQGGKVIRIGASSSTKLPEIHGLIDLSQVRKFTNWLDVFLISESRLFICTTSGPQFVAYSFGVPMLWTNAPDIANTYYFPKSVVLPKLVIDSRDRLYSLNEMVSSRVGWIDGRIDSLKTKEGVKLGLHWKNNDPKDIVEGVKDFFENEFLEENNLQFRWNSAIKQVNSSGNTPVGSSFINRWGNELFK
jgi:putative glycosyltransferase (TIGR04372 family)